MARTNSVYSQLVVISRDYLGPATERFIERQVMTHLHKAPAALTRNDLIELNDWIRLAFALLTNDPAVVDEYISRLNILAKPKSTDTRANR
jgi:hypothetical protein